MLSVLFQRKVIQWQNNKEKESISISPFSLLQWLRGGGEWGIRDPDQCLNRTLCTHQHMGTHNCHRSLLDVINSRKQWGLSGSSLTVFLNWLFRGVRWGLQRPPEDARQERDLRGHQDAEGRLHWQAEKGLPVWGQHHGPVRPPQHHSPRGRCHEMYVKRDWLTS